MVRTIGKVIPQGVESLIPSPITSHVFPELLIQGVVYGIGDHSQGPILSALFPDTQQPGNLFNTPHCRVVRYEQVVIKNKLVAQAIAVACQCKEHDKGEEKIPQPARTFSSPLGFRLW